MLNRKNVQNTKITIKFVFNKLLSKNWTILVVFVFWHDNLKEEESMSHTNVISQFASKHDKSMLVKSEYFDSGKADHNILSFNGNHYVGAVQIPNTWENIAYQKAGGVAFKLRTALLSIHI